MAERVQVAESEPNTAGVVRADEGRARSGASDVDADERDETRRELVVRASTRGDR